MLTVVRVYALHRLQTPFWREIFELVAMNKDSNILLLGDFNTTFDNVLDGSHKSVALELLKNFLEYADWFQIMNVWRKKRPTNGIILFSPIVISPFL